MKPMVEDLAKMSALRDRAALDAALVRLIAKHFQGVITSVWLLRVVADGQDKRCLSCALHGVKNVHPERDSFWADWSVLPLLDEFPLRLAAMQTLQVQSALTPNSTSTTVFPMNKPLGKNALLEVTTTQPIDSDTSTLVQGILLHYQNLMGLLDYGEKDTLTELLNRKTFDGAFFKATAIEHVPLERDGTERRLLSAQGGYWLAIIDIDHFKNVNDTYGHLIGDEVLLLLARLMRANFRFHDQLYRFGGEEFVVLLRCVSTEDTMIALERLRKQVQNYNFPQAGQITISTGFTALVTHDTPSSAFGRADKAVYFAKHHGRNQVCDYQTLLEQGHLTELSAQEMSVDLF
jgi:diguanylate cyclase (GGDEF)-like protein